MSQNTLLVKVSCRTQEAIGIDAFEFVPADDQMKLPPYEAGAHIDVHLPGGVIRQYSLCSRPDQEGVYRVAVLLDEKGRGGSRAMHDTVHPGDLVTISRPRNAFKLRSKDRAIRLMAGGVGITPILAMAYELQNSSSTFELHYFARSRNRLAFLAELEQGSLASKVSLHLDDQREGEGAPLDRVLDKTTHESDIYACGPAGFLHRIKESLESRNGPKPTLHYESFAPIQSSVGGLTFEVNFSCSRKRAVVGPEETIVEAARRVGVDIPISCEQGICGTCLTPVLEGLPDHRDMFLTSEEQGRNDQMTPCCSRSLSGSLTLDC
jgi:vanillate O-demethylase ferredoxin subunit